MAKRLKGKEEEKFLMQVERRIALEDKKSKKRTLEEKPITKKEFRRLVKQEKRRGKSIKGSRKVLAARAKRFSNLAKAFGTMPGQASGAGAGRPKGSYKYQIGGKPVSVFTWRKYMAQRKQQLAQFKAQQNQRLAQKGYQPEQLQQIRQQRVVQQVQQGKPVMERNVADEEAAFHEHLAQTTVTPNTQRLMTQLRRTQLKGQRDDTNQQRIHHERKLLSKQGNLMRAHENMRPARIDFSGVSGDNILTAPNVFKENSDDFILRKRARNILNTGEFTLKF